MASLNCSFLRSFYFKRLLVSSCSFARKTRRCLKRITAVWKDSWSKTSLSNVFDFALSGSEYFEVVFKRFERFGPLYQEQVLDTQYVSMCDVDAIASVLRHEKAFQTRQSVDALPPFLVDPDKGAGFLSTDYETWNSPLKILRSDCEFKGCRIRKGIPRCHRVSPETVFCLFLLTST